MAISAADVKELREISGAGILDCKKALEETGGDVDEALTFLQKKGEAAAEKKASRTAAEGLVSTWVSDDLSDAVLVEVNCETDFVSQNDQFQTFMKKVVETAGVSGATTIEDLKTAKVVGHDKTVADFTKDQITVIGENIQLRRIQRYSTDEGLIGGYVHAGGQIGVLVKVKGEAGDDLHNFARDVAMHVAAMNPGYLKADDIPEEDEAEKREFLTDQAQEMDKPAQVIEQIVKGRLNKWRAENVLLTQPFVKDSDTTVGELAESMDGVKLEGFTRFEVGEGIEVEEKSLSEEVAEELRGS